LFLGVSLDFLATGKVAGKPAFKNKPSRISGLNKEFNLKIPPPPRHAKE
jgi:hypothetical protein